MPDQNDNEQLLELSRKTDLRFAIKAVEEAKARFKEHPTPANSQALQAAIKMRDNISDSRPEQSQELKDWRATLAYITENGRKLGKSKMFADIKKGLLKKQADGTFKIRDVDRYMASLGMAGTVDGVADRAADRQRRKEEEEIRRIKAVADKEEFDLAVKKGRYILKDMVHLELAGRAAALETGLKTMFEARNLELIDLCEGNPKKSAALMQAMSDILDQALNEYSREMEFEVVFEIENNKEEV